MAWTTTPWTIPSNVALCVNPELVYVRARSPKGDVLVVAEARLPHMPGAAVKNKDKKDKGGKDAAAADGGAAAAPAAGGYTVLAKMKGAELVGAALPRDAGLMCCHMLTWHCSPHAQTARLALRAGV